MNDAFDVLAERATTEERHCLPWTVLVAAPIAAFVAVLVLMGVADAGAFAAVMGAQLIVVACIFCWSVLSSLQLAVSHDTVVVGLPPESTRFEREEYKQNVAKVTLFVPDRTTYLKFKGYRHAYGGHVIIKDVERVDTIYTPHRATEKPTQTVEYIGPHRTPLVDTNRVK